MDPAEFTIGIEEEYQLVDPETGELRGRAPGLLAADGPAKEEYQRTTLKVATPVCGSAAEAVRRLVECRRAIRRLAEAHGVALAAAGLHPVGPYPAEQLSDDAEFCRTADRGGSTARELHIFGLHVHIGVLGREAAVRAMCGTTPFIPHLLIPTASSPFYQGVDTGFESFRTLLRDMSPRVGPPPAVVSAGEYDRLERILAGGPVDPGRNSPIAWDVRPSNRYPTLEFRLFDANPWIDTIELVTAMARALTAVFVDRPAPQWTSTEAQLIRENRWRAARFGLDAELFRLDPVTGETRRARDSLLSLVDRLAPVAGRLGDGASLAQVDRIVERGSAAAAMRESFAREGSHRDVSHWVVEQTTAPTLAL